MSILGEHIISLHEKIDRLISLLPIKSKGKEKVAHSNLQPPPDIEDFKIKFYFDLENFLEKKFKGGGVQPINVENFMEGEPSHKNEFSDGINKISERYARKPIQRMLYYPKPTLHDVLLEEHEHIITNSYNGKKIYEWNIDGFTGQLKGWWDNYLNQDQQDKVLQAVKQEGEQYTQNMVYLIYLQKGSGRPLEEIVIKSREKEDTPKKKKKSSRKDYEKWKKKRIEKKLRRAEKGKGDSSKRRETYRRDYKKSDTCHKCGRFGRSESDYSGSERSSSTSEDLKALQQRDYITSEDDCSPCQQGMVCEKDLNEEDDLYKNYAQFKELSLNVIDNDKVLEILQDIKDPEIRAQIIDKISSTNSSVRKRKDNTPEEILTKKGSYTMAEVKNLLLERRKLISSPTTISDLKNEIDSLKEDIIRLKEKNVIIEVQARTR
ncbi:hypothetical protein KY290_030960 [Solanum tuberosum]|uniref:DUF7746 domain-containing protein n=1 Tax=Solanum tuberosum TaxID=4113 RepID=A0ABQ7U9L2_SOLTU|nr:hypothetical protein KY290_030960 [Solanum tuberosum]